MIALVSAKGSPGVTSSALAFTLTWPGRCLLAECDPAGGDILAGYLRGELDSQRGLAPLAVAELRGRMREEFARQLVDLDPPHRHRLVLPGVHDPAQSATVAPVWPAIADFLAQLSDTGQVIVDCGRVTTPHFGWPLLHAADRVLLVVRGTLPSASHAVPIVPLLRKELAEHGNRDPGRLGLLVIDTGPYSPEELSARLQVEIAAVLPADPRTARALSFGGPVHLRSPLARAAASVHSTLAVTRERRTGDAHPVQSRPEEVAGAA
ncbi:MAG TPA: ParA family protein [Natronosporangium sp.]|nr:ParA family protein [Natronosporangium sp.]